MSGKKWLPGDYSHEDLWSEDIEKPQKHGSTPAKVAFKAAETSKPEPRLSLRERAIELAKQRGTVRTKDLEAIGIPRQYPLMMCNEGLLVRVRYGVYRAATDLASNVTKPEEVRVSR
ncbi:hypothetical protein FG91_02993 [Sphingopyxis sp. LC81]|uniref:type IV toxin-antitoxin system AbiEi family antitoxin domain-containing protein n=1 Tax=Sphingopyxis sp. LC81 TaxID=1502850 RepID=UPI00050F3C34|nr:type IV toxin-antitoxin system AbiEi family antitoxin domain-containing protein [Sphingopyxis sp. LC81]KGB53062.1 hypothetical protein FG91_02993 [Sphingopyxis sp. LC81]